MKDVFNKPCSTLCYKGLSFAIHTLFEQGSEILLEINKDDAQCRNEVCFSLGYLIDSLQSQFGQETVEGLLFRIGEIALQYWRRQDSDLRLLGVIDNRLLPFERKISNALTKLRQALRKHAHIALGIEAAGLMRWEIMILFAEDIDGNAAEALAWLVQGILFEFLTWMDSRKSYQFSKPQVDREKQQVKFSFLVISGD